MVWIPAVLLPNVPMKSVRQSPLLEKVGTINLESRELDELFLHLL